MDCRKASHPTSFDLSAAFDTVDHGVLLSRFCTSSAGSDSVVLWISSYISNHSGQFAMNTSPTEPSTYVAQVFSISKSTDAHCNARLIFYIVVSVTYSSD